jgi:hypothetical protein
MKNKKKLVKPKTKWDEAISEIKKKIKRLQVTLAIYERWKKDGEPFPPCS